MAAALRFSPRRATPTHTLDIFEDDTTIPRRKKRRSSARRVSFAETQTVHVYQRDEEYITPPGAPPEAASKRGFPRDGAGLEGDMDTGSSTEKNAIAFAGYEVGEEAAGPVDINHITEVSHEDPVDDDVTLDSTSFSAKFLNCVNKGGEPDDNFSFHSDGNVELDKFNSKRSGSWESDMSFTVQNVRRPATTVQPRISTPASFDRSVTMQYTEVVDASTLAQRKQRVFRRSLSPLGKENDSPDRLLEEIAPKKLRLNSGEIEKRRPLQELSGNLESPQVQINMLENENGGFEVTESCCSKNLRSPGEMLFRGEVEEDDEDDDRRVLPSLDFLLDADCQSDVSGKTTPIPTLGSLLDRDTCTVETTFGALEIVEDGEETPLNLSSRRVQEFDTPAPVATSSTPRNFASVLDSAQLLPEKRQEPLRGICGDNVTPQRSSDLVSTPRPVSILKRQEPLPDICGETRETVRDNVTPRKSSELGSTQLPESTKKRQEPLRGICGEAPGAVGGYMTPRKSSELDSTPRDESTTKRQKPLQGICEEAHVVTPRISSEAPRESGRRSEIRRQEHVTQRLQPRVIFTDVSTPQKSFSDLDPTQARGRTRQEPIIRASHLESREDSIVQNAVESTPQKSTSEMEPRESERKRQEHLKLLQSKLEVSFNNSRRLESRKNLLLKEAEATQASYETLKSLYDRSRKLQASIIEWNSSKDDEGIQEQEILAMQKESQEILERVKVMKENLLSLNEKIQELASVPENCKAEQSKARFYQKIQGWHVTRVINKGDFYRLDISYGYRVNQSITIEGKGSQTCGWTTLIPDVQFIEKGFPHMNSRLLFQALLPGEKIKINNLKRLPTVLRQTSDLVMNLIQVAREAGECRVSHRCLQSVVFLNHKDHGICVQLSFENYKLRLNMTLLFSLQALSSGEYPKDILPCDITVESTRRAQSMISDLDVSKAISSIPAGYQRFHRICECVVTFLP